MIQQEVHIDDFRLAMSSWATGISIITSRTTGALSEPIGIVCNSIVSISLKEKLILWSVDKSSSSYSEWVKVEYFQIHFLAENQQDLVARFAKKGGNKFEGLTYSESKLGNPILPKVSVLMECQKIEVFDTPDHSLIVGKLVHLENDKRAPLLYLHSSLLNSSQLSHIAQLI